ncbi:UV DNA damage repair endonuclease UvsE [Evansella cellulosilytica]|uniref:UV-endonuclease UvdE n=1 Tax=Evansella cellulosilytica (strain ATCC 21833 / DSM 2522 / FERM P-1141 / JCM 9156 / N-4) TaxID=649639 RepID=E6U0E3_EVAC2|nr:UV DNA damage repair endonuclease UvsE [Evansella cellulosilytica]ADU30259.1 UV-endonuclease UvdE [Evansella cellulosilytica DSM 2522]
MTLVRLGYVAMSMELKNSSPSQTMTYDQFLKIGDKEAAIRKLERIAQSNIENCLRLLKHNAFHDIKFFRLSSRLIPLATHDALAGWNYLTPLKNSLNEIGEFINEHKMRIDFHPDHFVLLNSPKKEILKASITALKVHAHLLTAMKINLTHRCVLHVGGSYKDKEGALERFIENWGHVPQKIQKMIMLENDDKSFHIEDTLYLCEKLGIPLVFDLHHHLANNKDMDYFPVWDQIVQTWSDSPLPMKMHISSPKSEKNFTHHADYIDKNMFLSFLNTIKGSVNQLDCMIEAKQKDHALFRLIEQLKEEDSIEIVDEASFYLK